MTSTAVTVTLLVLLVAPTVRAADPPLSAQLETKLQPFLAAYCVSCHGKDKPKGGIDLSGFSNLTEARAELARLATVAEAITARAMPPEKAPRHPDDAERNAIVAFVRAFEAHEAQRSAGDPGPVLARRLSNAELDYSVRDLTGVDLRPAREFPVDPASEAGFDNSGTALIMSPGLLRKYLDAARAVADHAVLLPEGFVFAPHPVVTDTDRDRFAVERIVRFYQQQPTDLAAYFLAAWRYRHRAQLGQPRARLAEIATAAQLSPTYLARVHAALAAPADPVGPLARLQASFAALPLDEAGARTGAIAMRDRVTTLRPKLTPAVPNLSLKAVAAGSQPFVLWKNAQRAGNRLRCPDAPLYVPRPPAPGAVSRETIFAAAGLAMAVTHFSFRNIVHDSALPIPFGTHELAATFAPPDPALAIPDEAARPRYQAAFDAFCAAFPDAFYVAERGRVHIDQPKDRKEREDAGRLLSAGFHNMFGFFRDDRPLYDHVLDAPARRTLDGLWRELDFVTRAPVRQHADFIFYERAEGNRTIKGPAFDFVRSEDKSATAPATLQRLADGYLAIARGSLEKDGGDARAIPVLEAFFTSVSANVAAVERARRAAEPSHVTALLAFAEKAYRRPLATAERTSLRGFYRARRAEGLEHEDAFRDAIARVLLSPRFLYRADLAPASAARAVPLDGHALASRLSYFLWSSLPDAELLAHASSGALADPRVLRQQARRLLRDQRARALAVEFAGQWLDVRRFEEHNAVDRAHYPQFDQHLRQAMFEEPVRFFHELVRSDGSVLELVHGRHTFVNAPLARHYGVPWPADAGAQEWRRIDDADRYQRGGLLPMAVFLTKNAPGLRTSPVKRGYWLVRRLLGEHVPPPPAAVPELPTDERQLGALTLRETLARHRADPACAGCHARFDAYGLAFEGYGPIGERRTADLGGRPVETRVAFTGDPSERDGLAGLRAHLHAHRQDDFLDTLCGKLLAYALGRDVLLSDQATLTEMRARLAANQHRFGALIDTIVSSPQFRTRRGDGNRVSLAAPQE